MLVSGGQRRADVPLAGTASERLLLHGLRMSLLHLEVLHGIGILG
jgi:hypothetical protein